MQTRESKEFKRIILISESYSEALDLMTSEQALELNQVLEEQMVKQSYKIYAYDRAFTNYRKRIYRDYMNALSAAK